MEDIERYWKHIIGDVKQLIDKAIYEFLFILLKDIFLVKSNRVSKDNEVSKKLDVWISHINENIIKDNKKFINRDYTQRNLFNIIDFVKTQNKLFASEIIENILIIIFSFAFHTEKVNTFGKYIYNNIKKLRDTNNKDLADWFKKDNLRDDELKDTDKLLENDVYLNEKIEGKLNKTQKSNVFYNFLLRLNLEKFCFSKFISSKKFKNFSNRGDISFFEPSKTRFDIEVTKTEYTSIYNCNFFNDELGKGSKSPISVTRSFFISVYIYYQNKHSPLMNYIEESKTNRELAIIPFSYDLTGATIENYFAGIIMSPSRIEPRITELSLAQNVLKDKGLFELSKTLIFNKKIKIIDFHTSALKTNHLNSFNNGMGLFDNYGAEELNISLNYIKEDSVEYLSKILSHLKGLKTLNLTGNDLKCGISSLLIELKKLYRKGKINLENLILNKCSLDDISFYELGELLKSKYCKLKNLFLNMNNIPSNVNFIKKLKKNRGLTEIYFNKSNIGNNDSDNIMRVMSNTNIECLYLYKNRLTDFDDCLRMIYRTKLVLSKEEEEKKEKEKEIIHNDSCLYNLDLSNNDYSSKNIEQIELLKNVIEETTLYSLDLSHILFGPDPNKILPLFNNDSGRLNEYQKKVKDLKIILDEKQIKYKKIIGDINSYQIEKEKAKDDKNINEFKMFDDKIIDIIKDSNSRYPIYLKEKAKNIIIENKNHFDKNGNLNNNQFKEIEKKLVDYMNYKRSEKILEELKEKKKKKKLIII